MKRHRSIVWTTVIVLGIVVATLFAPAASAQRATSFEKFKTVLTGAQEPDGGDPDGFGAAFIAVNPATGLICYVATGFRIAPATVAHIHVAPAGVAGPVVLPLTMVLRNTFAGCATDAALAAAIVAAPANYYVNIHNADFPAGAIRGQLG
jgi:hypothetical protein